MARHYRCFFKDGAPGGNRTRVASLGSWCSTIELQMQRTPNNYTKEGVLV